MTIKKELNNIDKDRIIEMAWEDRTTFDAILMQFGLKKKKKQSMKNYELFVKVDLNAVCRDKLIITKFPSVKSNVFHREIG